MSGAGLKPKAMQADFRRFTALNNLFFLAAAPQHNRGQKCVNRVHRTQNFQIFGSHILGIISGWRGGGVIRKSGKMEEKRIASSDFDNRFR